MKRRLRICLQASESYDMLVTALEANADIPDMTTVTGWLLHEERKRKDRSIAGFEGIKEEVMFIRQKKKGPIFQIVGCTY